MDIRNLDLDATDNALHVLSIPVGSGDVIKTFVLKTTTSTGIIATPPVYPTYRDNLSAKAIYIFPETALVTGDTLFVGWTTTNSVDGATEIKTVHDGLIAQIATPGTDQPPFYDNTLMFNHDGLISYGYGNNISTPIIFAKDDLINTIAITSTGSGDIKVVFGIVQ